MDRGFRMFRQINRAIPYDVQGVEENNKQLHHNVLSKERNILKVLKYFGGIFDLVSEPNLREKRDMTVFWITS